ncbi:MAG: S8 family serine peptidase, partial [Bacteroidota bacterium]
LDYVQAPQAWDQTRGSANVKIGIIDTGLDYDHPEFEGQLWINSAEDLNGNGRFEPWPASEIRNGLSGDFNGVDEDGNGYADDVIGYDFVDQPRNPFGGDFFGPDSDPLDDNAHGTLVAGVIGAKADNQIGGAGLAPGCKLVTLRAFAASGGGDDDDIARSIVYAADNGIQLLNLSFGDVYTSRIMLDAIQYAYQRGVVMFASSGNGTGDNLHYPSGYNEVISISASTADLATGREFLWPLSSYGVTVDLCAPGANIFTTTLRDTAVDGQVTAYTRTQGTSFAAPMATAAAGLIFSKHGIQTPEQIRGTLTTSADDISDQGWDHFTGAGRLNINRALQVVGASNVQINSPLNDRGSPLDSIYIIGTVLDPEFVSFDLQYQLGTQDTSQWVDIITGQIYQRQRDTLALWDLRGLPEGDYTLRLSLSRSNGFTREDRIRFVRDLSPPEVEIKAAAPIWDNEDREFFVVFRSSDRARHVLKYRLQGSQIWRDFAFDRVTRNGEILMGSNELSPGNYEWYLESTNEAGLIGQTEIQTFAYQAGYIPENGWEELSYGLPLGRFLERPVDFDGDGLLEVVMSEYDQQLSFGPLKRFEFNGGFFVQSDSSTFRPVLIPKDLADTDQDGLAELLVSVNDSMYILEQGSQTGFPDQVIYRNEGNERYAAAFADTDADGQLELLAKDFEDYYIFEGQGGNFQETRTLADQSPNYQGSIAPRVLVEDFDLDGNPEILFGDFDGDLILHEYRGGSNYQLSWIDTTGLTKSGVYLCAGDFDGDGLRQEFFVATHPSTLRNDDFENEGLYWRLRIFKATDNDQYQLEWEDYLWDLDLEANNAATAGNLDDDPGDELVFTTYPRTYVLEFVNGEYRFTWFYYGSLATHHVIGDFNQNGINELGLGRIDSTKFFERSVGQSGPISVTQLQGFVLGANSIRLEWQPSPNATGYEVWRIRDPENNDLAEVATIGAVTSFNDNSVDSGVPYLFVLRALNPALTPQASGFGNLSFLTPHPRPRLDSAKATGPSQ